MPSTLSSQTVVRGQDKSWTFLLAGTGSIAGATYSANVRRRGGRGVLVVLTPTIADAAGRAILVDADAADTLLFEGDPADPTHEVEHVLDVYETLSGEVTVYGPLVFPVRDPA